jgi:hypothetical protein
MRSGCPHLRPAIMSWPSSIFVGGLTAAVGLVASGFVASLAVGWYRISSFEAKSAAFVASLAILGLLVGFIIGVVTSRVMAGGAHPGFLAALGASQGVLLGLIGVIGISARLLADVPPKIDGEELMLAVEIRWPEGHATSPTTLPGERSVQLGSVTRSSNTLRASSRGPLYTADARLVDGRWVAPGAVDIFTTRGRFVLTVTLDSATNFGFVLPLSGKPGTSDFKWSEWYPHARPGAPPLPNGFTYRYRVQRRSEPVRVETFGPFEVATIARYFYDQSIRGTTMLATMAEFRITHRGHPVSVQGALSESDSTATTFTRVDDIAAIAGTRPALLAHFFTSPTSAACYLLVDQGENVRSELIPNCTGASSASLLTSDAAAFRSDSAPRVPRGRFNRLTFEQPGLFLVGNAVLDTRRLTLHTFEFPGDFTLVPSLPPLAVSPDERSFARFGYAEDTDNSPVLLVTDVVASRRYMLPIDPARMRYSNIDLLDPAWVSHHFVWQRGADGIDSLVERKDFVPIPYHGELSPSGPYRTYKLEPAGEELRTALVEFLVSEMNAERIPQPADAGTYLVPVKIDGKNVDVAYSSGSSYVSVSMATGVTDTTLVEMIAHHFDAALATGKYDKLFHK